MCALRARCPAFADSRRQFSYGKPHGLSIDVLCACDLLNEGWDLITQGNIKSKFMEFVSKMDMSFSYKPILLKAMMRHANEDGCVALEDIVDYFKEYYEGRAAAGLVVEKPSSIFAKGGYTDKDVEKNILSNPFKRFADMRFFQRCKDVTMVHFNPWIYKKLDAEDFKRIHRICDKKLEEYYARFK